MHKTILCANTNEQPGAPSSLRQTLLCSYKTEADQVGIKLTSPPRDSSWCALLMPAGDFIVVSFGCTVIPSFSCSFSLVYSIAHVWPWSISVIAWDLDTLQAVCLCFLKARYNSVRFALNFWESKILLRALWFRTPFTSPTYPFFLLFIDTVLTTDDTYFVPKISSVLNMVCPTVGFHKRRRFSWQDDTGLSVSILGLEQSASQTVVRLKLTTA